MLQELKQFVIGLWKLPKNDVTLQFIKWTEMMLESWTLFHNYWENTLK